MKAIKPDIYWVGALDFSRRLFDALVPTPDGTSYNAYLVKGNRKQALIDTVDPNHASTLMRNLDEAQAGPIDYVVINHAEQDHSGSLPAIMQRYPQAVVVANAKCRDQLRQLLHIPTERVQVIQDRETLDLGGRTLEFIMAPWVHWPETMFTYLREDRVLFSCDFLGAHWASTGLLVDGLAEVYQPAKSYYAEIMMPFRSYIKTHLEKVGALSIDLIAPSHGPVHCQPRAILDAYRQWSADDVKNEVVVPYVSMHGSTEKMVNHFIRDLMRRDIMAKPFDLTVADVGKLATALVEAATVVFATPTVLMGPHPLVVYAAYVANALKPKTRFASVIGSFGWAGKTAEQVMQLLSQLSLEVIPPVLTRGAPRDQDFIAIENLAQAILEKHKQLGIA